MVKKPNRVVTPPPWAIVFLRWICPATLHESIEGDLLEQFDEDVCEFGEGQARRKFIFSVLKFLRPGIVLRKTLSNNFNGLDLFLNTTTIAWRHILRDKTYSVINVVGLSLSMAVGLLVLQYARFELGYDSGYKNAMRIYRVTTDSYDHQELVYKSALSSLQVGPAMGNSFPEVLQVTQLLPTSGWFNCTMKYDDGHKSVIFNEHSVFYGDSSFFALFSWPLISGDVRTALKLPWAAVITESTANRYFGDEEAVGKTLHLKGSVDEHDYLVTGIMPDLPQDSHLKVEVLLSARSLDTNPYGNRFDSYTYVLLSNPAAATAKMAVLGKKLFGKNDQEQRLGLQPLRNIHLDARWQDEIKPSGNSGSVYFLLIAAAFIIVIALINYVNLSTARAMERAREVGVRKVSGAHRMQLIRQFLMESMMVQFFSLTIAGLIVLAFSSSFYSMLGLPFSISSIFQSRPDDTELYLLGAFLLAIFLAALYPARMVSAYNPAVVLKGRLSGSTDGLMLRRGLVVFQFICSIGLLTGVYAMHDQHEFMQEQDLGVDISRTLIIRAPSNSFDTSYYRLMPQFKANVEATPWVSSVTSSSAVPGEKIEWVGNIRMAPGQPVVGRNFSVDVADPDFINTFKLKLIAGRGFCPKDYPAGRFGSKVENLILNGEAVRQLRFATPEGAIDKIIYWDDNPCAIVGVVADFHQQSFKNRIQPTLFTANLGPNVAIKLNPLIAGERMESALDEIRKHWQTSFPDGPFDYYFLEDLYARQYSGDVQVMRLFDVFCVLAILVSCLGLFGLSLFTTRQRMKEMGIRKVLGASWTNLIALLTTEFLRPIIFSSLIALPLSYYMIQHWLMGFAFHMDPGGRIFLLPVLIVFITALVTVSYQTIRSVAANPADTLKHE